jgi:hypothetical protein
MKKLAIPLVFLFSVSAALAQAPPSKEQDKGATKELTAKVLATDPAAKTITVSREDGPAAPGMRQETTLPVEAKALAVLKTVNPGEKVKLLCRTDVTGKETAVTAIEKSDKPSTIPPESW